MGVRTRVPVGLILSARLVGGMLLPPVPEAAGRARWELARILKELCSWYDPSDCVLMVSELVSNAVKHANFDGFWVIHVACWCDGGEFRVEVYNPGTGKPVVQRPGPDDTQGRGLLLVEAASHSWGTATTAEGTMVWFSVRLP